MTQAKFTKGQAVYAFHSWDGKGTVSYKLWNVHSAGAKRMYLVDPSGKMAKCEYSLRLVNNGINGGHPNFIEHFSDVPNPEARALEIAAQCIAAYHEHYDQCIAHYAHGDTTTQYSKSIERSRLQIHEPRALDREQV